MADDFDKVLPMPRGSLALLLSRHASDPWVRERLGKALRRLLTCGRSGGASRCRWWPGTAPGSA